MKQFRNNVIRAGLGALYLTGAHYLLRPIFAGVGAIFMLHHVRPKRDAEFQPNHHLEVAPGFLRAMLAHLRSRGIDIITMDEVHQRLIERDFSRRFACFTLDDGYRDNRDFALPVMREFDAPLAVYVASDFAEGIGRLWWVALEMVIAKASSIEASIGGYRPNGLRSVRIAESAPDFSTVINASGKYVTHGINFDTDSDRLKTESGAVLKQVAAGLQKNPNLKLEIDGHTDSVGDAAHNLDLSKRRAQAVSSVLVSQFGIDAGRLSVNGFGASKPIGSNDTPEGRASNRRVEFLKK